MLAELENAQKQFNNTLLESDLNTTVKGRLEEFRKPKIEGLIVRSRVQWHEQGEKSSILFNTRKRNSNIKNIQYIKKNDRIVTKTSKILKEFSGS